MMAVIFKHLCDDCNVSVSYESVKDAFAEAGRSGKYETVGQAANDQETLCRAHEIEQDRRVQNRWGK